eukprot:1965932-Amphidinium_carterae.1
MNSIVRTKLQGVVTNTAEFLLPFKGIGSPLNSVERYRLLLMILDYAADDDWKNGEARLQCATAFKLHRHFDVLFIRILLRMHGT